jgi:hypothetical protein
VKAISMAEERLAQKLADLVEKGVLPVCSADPDRWFAESIDDRRKAAAECAGCPALTECEATALVLRPRFGVWAGRDWTPRPHKAVTP